MPDPDLEIGGGGGREGAISKNNFFWPFGPQFGQERMIQGTRIRSLNSLSLCLV